MADKPEVSGQGTYKFSDLEVRLRKRKIPFKQKSIDHFLEGRSSVTYLLEDWGEIYVRPEDVIAKKIPRFRGSVAEEGLEFKEAEVMGYTKGRFSMDIMEGAIEEICKAYKVEYQPAQDSKAGYFHKKLTDPEQVGEMIKAVKDACVVLENTLNSEKARLRDAARKEIINSTVPY